MEDNREDTLVECPFYKWNSRSTITCEGIAPSMNTQQTFSSPADQVNWKKRYCRSMNFSDCIHAQALAKIKYRDQ